MWVFVNDAFLSIVQSRDDSESMVVRARAPGDITRAFAGMQVDGKSVDEIISDAGADYSYRAFVPREVVEAITYPNFKNSIGTRSEPDPFAKVRKDFYGGVWGVMLDMQDTVEHPELLEQYK